MDEFVNKMGCFKLFAGAYEISDIYEGLIFKGQIVKVNLFEGLCI